MNSRRDLAIAGGLALLAFILYALAAPTGLMGADNGEFVTLSRTAGVAHPPGYPLYTIYLRAFAWLPGVNAAHTAALATGILGATTVGLLFAALRCWRIRAEAAVIAALLFAVDTNIWSLHSHAEAFALNNLFAAAIFLAAAPEAPARGLRRALFLGALAGLGLSNHHSIVLLLPVGIFGIYLAQRESEKLGATLLLGASAGAVALAPYLYLFTAPACETCLSWGHIDTLADLGHHFLRADYGTTQLGIGGEPAPLAQWSALVSNLLDGTLGVLLIVAGLGIAFALRRQRTIALVFLSSFLISGVLFTARFNVAPEGIGDHIVSRFHALPLLCLVPFAALALDTDWFEKRRPVLVFAGLLVCALAVRGGVETRGEHTGGIDAYVHDTLAGVAEDGILVGTGDHRLFGIAYHQIVLEERTDVLYVEARLLAYDWYVSRLESQLGHSLPRTDDQGIPIAAVLGRLLQTGRPLYATHPFTEPITRLPNYPLGTNLRLLPPGSPGPSPYELARQNAELFDRFVLTRSPAEVSNPWELEVYDHYRRTWKSLAAAFGGLGDAESAARAEAFAAAFDPSGQRAAEP